MSGADTEVSTYDVAFTVDGPQGAQQGDAQFVPGQDFDVACT